MRSVHVVTPILPLMRVLQRDARGRITKALIPGSEGKRYSVILRRVQAHIETQCYLDINGTTTEPCPGNTYHVLCYHVQATLLKAAREAGFQHVAFCYKLKSARKLLNLGTYQYVQMIWSRQSKRAVYMVYGRKL